jgi:Ca-activated chloride channel homolog
MLGRIVLAGCLALPLAAQEAKPSAAEHVSGHQAHPAPIKVQVNEVVVPVTVTDQRDRFVSDLEKKDFRIYDEGKLQKVLYFSRERSQPVVVGFLLDLSNASRLHWAKFQEAALELVFNLLPGDPRFSGYLISFGNDAELQVNTTSDSEKIVEKIRKLKPGGGAAFFDAIYMACTRRSLVEGEPIEPRRVLIVIGDGHDSASKHSLQEVLELAQRNLITIYGMSTVAFGFNSEGEQNLKRLAEDTGGRVEYPLQGLYSDVSGFLSTPSDEGNYALKVGTGQYAAEIAKGIFDSVAALAGEVTTQYILRYVPESTDTARTFRNIRVDVNIPNAKVRARKGYFPYAP